MQYARLALVQKEDVTLIYESLNVITKLTLQGEMDKILKKKEQLGELRDIFHHQNKTLSSTNTNNGTPRRVLLSSSGRDVYNMSFVGIGKTTLNCQWDLYEMGKEGWVSSRGL